VNRQSLPCSRFTDCGPVDNAHPKLAAESVRKLEPLRSFAIPWDIHLNQLSEALSLWSNETSFTLHS